MKLLHGLMLSLRLKEVSTRRKKLVGLAAHIHHLDNDNIAVTVAERRYQTNRTAYGLLNGL